MTAGNHPSVVKLSITGMTCSACAAAVERALSSVPGVRKAAVDLDQGRAVVEGIMDAQALVVAVERAGFQAEAPFSG